MLLEIDGGLHEAPLVPGHRDQRHAHGQPRARAEARGQRGHREAGDVPGGGEDDQGVAGAPGVAGVIARAPLLGDERHRGLEHQVDAVLREPRLPPRGHLGSAAGRRLPGGGLNRAGGRRELGDAGAVALRASGVAAVVGPGAGEQDGVQVAGREIGGGGHIDHGRAEALAGRAGRVVALGDVGMGSGGQGAGGDGHRQARER